MFKKKSSDIHTYKNSQGQFPGTEIIGSKGIQILKVDRDCQIALLKWFTNFHSHQDCRRALISLTSYQNWVSPIFKIFRSLIVLATNKSWAFVICSGAVFIFSYKWLVYILFQFATKILSLFMVINMNTFSIMYLCVCIYIHLLKLSMELLSFKFV